eukprot:6268136-Prymnesium_polylepis.1
MPPKKAAVPIALKDKGHVHGWYYSVDAGLGLVQISLPGKRVKYKLTKDCPMTRRAQRREIGAFISRTHPDVGRGDADDTDDDRSTDRSRSSSRGRSRSRSCTRSDDGTDDGADSLGLTHDLLSECSAFVSEATAAEEGRYPRRRRASVEPYSPSKGWSEFELERTGSRHERTREVSYEES